MADLGCFFEKNGLGLLGVNSKMLFLVVLYDSNSQIVKDRSTLWPLGVKMRECMT
jgi:hypothetical protein